MLGYEEVESYTLGLTTNAIGSMSYTTSRQARDTTQEHNCGALGTLGAADYLVVAERPIRAY